MVQIYSFFAIYGNIIPLSIDASKFAVPKNAKKEIKRTLKFD